MYLGLRKSPKSRANASAIFFVVGLPSHYLLQMLVLLQEVAEPVFIQPAPSLLVHPSSSAGVSIMLATQNMLPKTKECSVQCEEISTCP